MDKNKLLQDLHYLRYKYPEDSAVNNLVTNLLDTLDNNYIVNKNQLNNFLDVTESKIVAFGDDVTKLTTGVTTSIICRDDKISKEDLKDYLCTQFGYQLEHLNEDVTKVIKKKSDLDSDEKKMIKFLKREMNLKNLEDLQKWYERYEREERSRMNESLNRLYHDRNYY